MKLTKSTLKQIIKEELGNHGLKHIKIEKLPNGQLQGVWNTTINNLEAAEHNDWIGPPDDVDQFSGTRSADGEWRQEWEYEEEKKNVYWRESWRDENEFGVKNSREGFMKRMKEYDSNIESNIDTVAESKIKLSKSKLEQIVKEELQNIIKEGLPSVAFQKFGGLGKGLPGVARQARALKPIDSTDSPSFVLYYNTGEKRKIQLDDKQWRQLGDMSPDLQDVEKLRSILSPEDTRGLEDVKPVMENSESDPGLEASRKQAVSTDHKGSTSFLPREEPEQSSRWNREKK